LLLSLVECSGLGPFGAMILQQSLRLMPHRGRPWNLTEAGLDT
jgi:hypothetical protein